MHIKTANKTYPCRDYRPGEDTVIFYLEEAVPEPEPPVPQLTTEEAIMEMVTDLDYRTSLLELGIGGTL